MKYRFISFYLLLHFLLLGKASFTQVYYSLTDSLLKPNHVRLKTMITMDGHLAERWSYDKNGNLTKHINYYPVDSLPMMSTELEYDSDNRLSKSNTDVLEGYKDKKIMVDILGQWLIGSHIDFKRDSLGKLTEELHTGRTSHSETESMYSVSYDYTPNGRKIKKTVKALNGIIRDQWVYNETATENMVTQTTYDPTGKKIRTQVTYYEKADIISRIVNDESITTYQNSYDKKGQLVKTVRQNNTGKTAFQFSYLPNGLLEKITSSKSAPETARFEYQYY